MDYTIVSREPTTIEYLGEQYKIGDLATLYNLPAPTIRYRINKGMDFDDVIADSQVKQGKYEYKGKVYTLQGLSKRFRKKPETLRNRFRRGWSVEKAVSEPVRGGKVCYAKSYEDCFKCRFKDCIVEGSFPGVDFKWCDD